MKIKSLIGSALAWGVLSGISFNAAAEQLTPVQFTGSSFNDLALGSITITGPSSLVGSVFAAESIGTQYGSFTLSKVSFSSGTVGGLVDLDPSAAGFSFARVVAGTYAVLASGTLTTPGQIPGLGFIGVNYLVTAVPEPESYAMMLAGLGLLGFASRRRKQHESAA